MFQAFVAGLAMVVSTVQNFRSGTGIPLKQIRLNCLRWNGRHFPRPLLRFELEFPVLRPKPARRGGCFPGCSVVMQTKALDSGGKARKEVALGFYARGLISLGKAVEMSGASRMEFEGWLGERKIVRPFSEEDLRHELDWDWSEPEG